MLPEGGDHRTPFEQRGLDGLRRRGPEPSTKRNCDRCWGAEPCRRPSPCPTSSWNRSTGSPPVPQKKVREFIKKFRADPKSSGHQLREAPGPQGRPRPDGADRPEVPGGRAASRTRATCTSSSGSTTTTRRWTGPSGDRSRSTPARVRCRSICVEEVRQAVPAEAVGTQRAGAAGSLRRRRAALVRSARDPAARRAGDQDAGRGCSPWASTCPPKPPRPWSGLPRANQPRVRSGGDGQSTSRSNGGHDSDLVAAPRAPRFPPPLRDDPIRRGTELDPRCPAGEVAGIPAPQPGAAGGQDIQRPRPGHRWGGDGQDRRGDAPGSASGPNASAQVPQDRILFTTYTANLAQNVGENLAHLCGPEKDRIEVVHLHAWAARFLRDQGRKFEVASPAELDACWEEAIRQSERAGVRPRLLAAGVGSGHPGQRDRDRRRLPEGGPDRAGTYPEPAPAAEGLEGLSSGTSRPCSGGARPSGAA